MVYQPPAGARDLLPLDVAQKRWIEDRLQQVFHRWGYHRIITSTLERLDTLMAGGAIGRATVLQLKDAEEELGLRPELTASIARTAVTRMAGVTYPQRLYYNANVFRRTRGGNSHNRQQEFYQAGVELLGSDSSVADAEVLLLLADCLNHLGLSQWYVILGEAGIARSLLSTFPVAVQDKVRQAIAALDRVGLEQLPLSPELLQRARVMLDLRGQPPNVLQKILSLDLDLSQQQALTHLKSLVSLLDECFPSQFGPSGNFPLILDLSLLQTIDYYTGVVFEVVSVNQGRTQILGRGGRYDQLLGLYHPHGETIPGIGFSLNIEDLHQVLLQSTNNLPPTTPASNWLVVPQTPQAWAAAFAYAEKLRNSTHLVRVEIDLDGRNPEEIRGYARHRRIQQIAWVKSSGLPVIERIN